MTAQTLDRARAGDEDAFRELTDPYRRELQLHVYRIVGSAQDAEDLLQETLLAAWRGLEQFEGRASVRAWLYRIATNRSLDALRASRHRPEDLQRMTEPPEPTRRAEPIWLEPYPDILLEGIPDDAPGPQARYESKEAISLAFIAGLQHLPPQQRAVLVLRDVLGFRAEEAAEMLETTDTMVALLTDEAWVTMPPERWEYQGTDAIRVFLRDREVRRGALLRLVPTRANGQPAFGCYLPDAQAEIARAYALFVLTLGGDRIS